MARKKSVEQRAKEAGASGRRLSAAKQTLRDSRIVQRKAQGWPIDAIAAEAEISSPLIVQYGAIGAGVL